MNLTIDQFCESILTANAHDLLQKKYLRTFTPIVNSFRASFKEYCKRRPEYPTIRTMEGWFQEMVMFTSGQLILWHLYLDPDANDDMVSSTCH